MNPTLSERLQAHRRDPFWRAHPVVPWGTALETPVALQALEAARQREVARSAVLDVEASEVETSEVEPRPAFSQLAVPEPGPPPLSLVLARPRRRVPGPPAERPAAPAATPDRQAVLLLLLAIVGLVEGWQALRHLRRPARRRSGAAPAEPPQAPPGVSVRFPAAALPVPCQQITPPIPAGIARG